MNLEYLQSLSDTELNELAAVKVMGWEKSESKLFWDERFTTHQSVCVKEIKCWNPAGDMNDAMELVKKVIDHTGLNVHMIYTGSGWECSFCGDIGTEECDLYHMIEFRYNDPELTVAICGASILAKE